ncbi:MAG: hypothetical protein KAI17_23870, partial [Thiotrichaceae bacterium]|nr:hypothetical protein [Thiotrichaceae bacterium]
LQKENRRKGIYPKFKKSNEASFLAYKTTRHHELLHKYLEAVKNVHIVSIVRHPCAVINSWIRSDNEFEKKGCTLSADWKAGACRKEGVGEYWGFDDWLSVTQDHVSLSHKYSNFNILEYSDLIRGSEGVIYKLFKQLLIPYTKQTAEFLKDCHSSHDDDPYSVFKSASAENKWKSELDSDISHEIIRSAKAANLGQFLK